jgi:hypothetical protein
MSDTTNTDGKKRKRKKHVLKPLGHGEGIEALKKLAREIAPAPTGPERLAQARKERDAKVVALFTPDAIEVAKGLRAKGFGYSAIADTITSFIGGGVSVSVRHVKAIIDTKPAPQQAQTEQRFGPAPQPVRRGGGISPL